jgi:hypothetical protein
MMYNPNKTTEGDPINVNDCTESELNFSRKNKSYAVSPRVQQYRDMERARQNKEFINPCECVGVGIKFLFDYAFSTKKNVEAKVQSTAQKIKND